MDFVTQKLNKYVYLIDQKKDLHGNSMLIKKITQLSCLTVHSQEKRRSNKMARSYMKIIRKYF